VSWKKPVLVPTAQMHEVYGALAQRLYLVFTKKLELGKVVRGLLIGGRLLFFLSTGKTQQGSICREKFPVGNSL
jgi:hypothetical protein